MTTEPTGVWICSILGKLQDGEPELLRSEIDHMLTQLTAFVVAQGSGGFVSVFDVEASSATQAAAEGVRMWSQAARRGALVANVEVVAREPGGLEAAS